METLLEEFITHQSLQLLLNAYEKNRYEVIQEDTLLIKVYDIENDSYKYFSTRSKVGFVLSELRGITMQEGVKRGRMRPWDVKEGGVL